MTLAVGMWVMRPLLFPLGSHYRCHFTTDYYDVKLIHTSKERIDNRHEGSIEGVAAAANALLVLELINKVV